MLYLISDNFNCLQNGKLNKNLSEEVILNKNTLTIYKTWNNLRHALINSKLNNIEAKYLAVYEISEERNIFIEPIKLEYDEVVLNATEIGEYWVYNGLSSEPNIIKVNNLQDGIFERDIEDYHRKEDVTFYKKKDFLHFQWLCKNLGFSLTKNIVSNGKDKIYHIEYSIPRNKSAKSLWYFHNKILQHYKKKHII